MDAEFLFDGVAIVCRGTVESAKALLGVLRGHCGAEGKSLLGVVSGGNVELDRARGEGPGPRLCGPVERDRLRLIEIIAYGHRQMDFVADGEDFRRFELSEEGKKSADVSGTRGDMSIKGGGDDGNFPGRDAVSERNLDRGVAGAIGVNFGLPEKRFRKILAETRRGQGDVDLTGSGPRFRGQHYPWREKCNRRYFSLDLDILRLDFDG